LLGLDLSRTVKSIVLTVEKDGTGGVAEKEIWLLLLRGDHELNEVKVNRVPGLGSYRFASEAEIVEWFGAPPGYLRPIGTAKPVRIYGTLNSANYFDALGVRPILGRALLSSPQDERMGAAEAVLGYELWQRQFAADPSIVGKTIQVNLHTYTIVGVAPKDFQGCKSGLRSDIWIPLGMYKQVWGWDPMEDRGKSFLNILGVLRPGVDRHQAENELNLLMEHLAAQYPTVHQGQNQIFTDPLWRSPFGANIFLAGTLPILLALAAVLLLLACHGTGEVELAPGRRERFRHHPYLHPPRIQPDHE